MFRPTMIDSRDTIRSETSNGTLNFQTLDVEFLGSKALSVFIGAIETGMIIVLFSRFIVRRRERLAIQLLVYLVTFVALYVAFEHVIYYIASLNSDKFFFQWNSSHTHALIYHLLLDFKWERPSRHGGEYRCWTLVIG